MTGQCRSEVSEIESRTTLRCEIASLLRVSQWVSVGWFQVGGLRDTVEPYNPYENTGIFPNPPLDRLMF
jgi:hypothetical protein